MSEKKAKQSDSKNAKSDVKEPEVVESTVKKTSDDNMIAAAAHISFLILPAVLPFVIWLVYKDKSEYVRRQSLQATVYQAVGTVALIGLWFVAIILSFVLIGIILLPVVGLLGIAYAVYAIIAAVKCFNGEDFRYAVIADLIEKRA